MGFEIDYSLISIDEYKEKLKKKHLVPSRKLLLDNLDERLDYFKSVQIKNVAELTKSLKNKTYLKRLSEIEPFNFEYLTILLRELKSVETKKSKLTDFEDIPEDVINKLEKLKIKNTKQLYPKIITKEDRDKFSSEQNIDRDLFEHISKLVDLSRVQWVNHTFAKMLYDVGVTTIKDLQESDDIELHEKINRINREREIFRGKIGLNDITICIEAAKEVPIDTDF